MGCLIILRGTMGVGKSSVRDYLMTKLGRDKTVFLNLDEVVASRFDPNITQALSSENVVGEMFYGNSHTDNPESWIRAFKDRKFNILSAVLSASYSVGLKRFMDSEVHKVFNKSETFYRDRYSIFQSKQDIFAKKAGVREVVIDTDKLSVEQIGEEILKIKSS
jgi:thymidylate kinase